ncbi:MAG TPA: extracellular solute-binding protein [Candidatus Wallbacteria bacterium]|nr:extracellular solute-binding protein [Candidatus Wallbacteria bacterium]
MSKTIKSVLVILNILSMLALSSPAMAGGKTEITVWAMGSEGKLIRAMADEFEKLNPEISVVTQAIPWNGAHEKLITSVIGNIPPDISQMGTTWMSEFHSMNALERLDGYIAPKGSQGPLPFFEGSLASIKFPDGIYGLPWYVDTRVVFYRKDIIKEAGYETFPATWDEMFIMLKKIMELKKSRNETGYAINLPAGGGLDFLPFLFSAGSELLDKDMKISAIRSKESAAAFEFYKKIFTNGLAPLETAKDVDIFNAFDTGFYPIFISGPWMISEIDRSKPNLNGKWATAKFPSNRSSTSFIGGCNLVIFKESRNKQAAYKFLEFMSSAENQAKWYKISKDLPANPAAWADESIKSNIHLNTFYEQLKSVKAPPGVAEWEQILSFISEVIEKAVYEKKTVDESLLELESKINDVMRKESATQTSGFKASMVLLFLLFFAALLGAYFKFSKPEKDSVSFRRHSPAAYIFIAPAAAVLFIFLLMPLGASFMISLTNWNIYGVNDYSKIIFTGFDNYVKLLSDPIFYISLRNTLIFAFIGVPLSVAISLFSAVALNHQYVKFKPFFRTAFFIPVITTMVAVAVIWRWLYNPELGIFNWVLGLAGIPGQNWLSNGYLALPSLILMAVWKGFGYNMIIFIAAIQAIPSSIYEAAEIDGATETKKFLYVTIPMLSKTTFFIVLMTSIGYLQFFAEPYIMTAGGPMNGTMSVVLYMYNHGFKYYNLGYSSAIAYLLFGIIIAFTYFQIKFSKKFDV